MFLNIVRRDALGRDGLDLRAFQNYLNFLKIYTVILRLEADVLLSELIFPSASNRGRLLL